MYSILSELLRPFGLLMVLTSLALANLWRKRTESRTRLCLLTIPFTGLMTISLPITGLLAIWSLERLNPPSRTNRPDAQAIVVLSGYVNGADAYHERPTLATDTMERCLHAVEVYRRRPLPVVVCGGIVNRDHPALSAAEVMRDFMVELGVKKEDVLLEGRSLSTYENAVQGASILRPLRIQRIILVTDGCHMFRAGLCFQAQGLTVDPSGCRYRATEPILSPRNLYPTPSAPFAVIDALHEWVGLIWYKLHHRI